MKNLLLACVLISFSATAGCGGDSGGSNIAGGPACSVDPCGGDITGTWNATEMCVDKSVLMAAFVEGTMGACPQAKLTTVSYPLTGSFTFNTDSTYALSLTLSASIGVSIPSSCINVATCADLTGNFTSDPDVQSATCTGTSTCTCTITQMPDSSSETGTYSVSGTNLLTTATGSATTDTIGYCVKGTTLTFREPGTVSTASGLFAIVATK